MSAKIFQNEAARLRLEMWFNRFQRRVKVPVESCEVPTSHGANHVLLAGNKAAPPLVLLHGSLASSAHILPEMGPLLEQFCVIAPDLPGQSVRGLPVRLSLKDDALARWLLEVMDGLSLSQCHLYGVSWGGFVAWQTAALAPERFRRLTLMVPAGLVTGSAWAGGTQIMLPLMKYKLRPSEPRLRRLVSALFTTWDDDWAHYMGDAFRDFVLDFSIPPLATDEQLRALKMPVQVFAGSDDISFPGEKLIARVKACLPQAETHLIEDCKHSPPTTDEFRLWMADRVTAFCRADGL